MKVKMKEWALLRLLRVTEVGSKREKRIFRKIWTSVWEQEGYAHEGEPLAKIEPHYDALAPQSTDLILWVGPLPIGTMRIVWEGTEKLPVLSDFNVKKCWEGPVVEFTLLTLKREWRGLKHIPSFLLMRGAYHRIKGETNGVVIAADERLFGLFQKVGIPFKQIGPSEFYEGSNTVPAFLPVPEVEQILGEANPVLAKFFFS